jgi:hypothetical protein
VVTVGGNSVSSRYWTVQIPCGFTDRNRENVSKIQAL